MLPVKHKPGLVQINVLLYPEGNYIGSQTVYTIDVPQNGDRIILKSDYLLESAKRKGFDVADRIVCSVYRKDYNFDSAIESEAEQLLEVDLQCNLCIKSHDNESD